ncbi:LacI family DNA-binding transcriptional regulator [Microbacterium sp. P03]|uniref:LacI family DNA-binding transcriptional regulator n=1 Tax=Microbacterium sp. P03 TaxID=3366946 RepID=UPI00374513B2
MSAAGAEHAPRVGVRDVARLAGVSTQTVSRVINDVPNVREDTRQRVREAMATLDYRVNNAARSLGTRTTRTIGVIASDSTLYGPSVGIAAVEAAARAAGRWVATVYADAGDEASVRSAVDHLRAQGVDGVILIAPHIRTQRIVADAGLRVPLAALHEGSGAQRQADGVALVVGHLADLGHRVIARVGGPGDWWDERARATGFESALRARGLETGPQWAGDWSADSGAAAAPRVAAAVRAPGGPTAVVVANDQMALGLIAGLEAAGVDVPDDVSVAGFDDNPDAAYYRPALTTVRLDIAGEAARVVAAVLAVDAPTQGPPSVVPPVLAVRDSTAPLRAERP